MLVAATGLDAGRRCDRRRRNHLQAVATVLAFGAVAYGALALGTGLRIGWLLVAAAVAAALGRRWVGVLNFVVVRSHSQAPARSIAITQAGGSAPYSGP